MDHGDSRCDFCEIVAGQKAAREVLQTEHLVGFFPIEPATLGHTLLIPRRHIPDIWTIDGDTAHHLVEATIALAHAIREAMNPDGLNVIQSNGNAATQTVLHIHVHLIPRWQGDDMGRIWPDAVHWTEQAKDDACRKIRTAYSDRQERESR